MYGAEDLTLRKADQKYVECFEILCWRRMEISWTHSVRNEEILRRVKEKRNILHTVKRRKDNWIGHVLPRCLPKHVSEGEIEEGIKVTAKGERRVQQLLDGEDQLD